MKAPIRSSALFVSALVLAALALALPGTASARSACKSGPCTYYGWTGEWPGHCGPHDTECFCFANEGGGEQDQDACNAEIEG